MQIIRWFLGKILLLLDRVFSPAPIRRSLEEQKKIDQETAGLQLYQFEACPFCIKVRRAMRRLALNIELKDAQPEGKEREELAKEGGKIQVPCLRVGNQWMYESNEIIQYLENRFS